MSNRALAAAARRNRLRVASRDPRWHNWDHNRDHYYNNEHYRWYNNSWVVVDPIYYPSYVSAYPYWYDYDYDSYPDVGYYPEVVGEFATSIGGVATAPSIVDNVQSALANAGYYTGSVDGIMGPLTRDAITAYQQDNGLPVTGTITPSLLRSLGLS